MPRILLTGAGFSKNWGGWLADEAFEYLLGCPQLDEGIREVLWRYKRLGGGFEAALDELQTQTPQNFSLPLLDQVTKLEEAIRGMFADMDKAFAALGWLNFNISLRANVTPDGPVTEFLDKFDAIFTLNQDSLIELQYKADAMSMLLHPKVGTSLEWSRLQSHQVLRSRM
jgi:hypothetical protein